MGRFYKYKCKSCDFEKEYFTGGGFFTEDYYNKSKELEKKLMEDALSGKYGDIVKVAVEADTEKTLHFLCETDLFQCDDCKEIIITREKEIRSYNGSDREYNLKIEIRQKCPKCGSKHFKKIKRFEARCPKCKKGYLELVSLGNWD